MIFNNIGLLGSKVCQHARASVFFLGLIESQALLAFREEALHAFLLFFVREQKSSSRLHAVCRGSVCQTSGARSQPVSGGLGRRGRNHEGCGTRRQVASCLHVATKPRKLAWNCWGRATQFRGCRAPSLGAKFFSRQGSGCGSYRLRTVLRTSFPAFSG